MKRIDLHTHTQNLKSDGKKRIISESDYAEKMKTNDVGICAVTNHNFFDIDEFRNIRNLQHDFVIFPGIELDVQITEGEDKRHIIVIGNPDKDNVFKEVFSNPKENAKTFFFDFDSFVKAINKFDKDEVIIIPHFYDKDGKRRVTPEEKDKIKTNLFDYTIILETSKLRSMGIVNAHNELSLIGSDVKDWDEYSEKVKELPELKFSIDSYGKFYELANDTKHFVKTVLDGREKEIIDIDSNQLDVFKDINIIFGGKGSGKTVLLERYLAPLLQQKGFKTIIHAGKNYHEDYLKMLETFKEKTKIDEILKNNIISNLTFILSYNESPNLNFIERVIKHCKNTRISKKAALIKKTESKYTKTFSYEYKDLIEEHETNIKKINDVQRINKTIRKESDKHYIALYNELNLLKIDLLEKLKSEWCERFSTIQTEKFLKNTKSIIEKKTGKVGKLNNYGFSKRINDRKKMLYAHKKLVDDLKSLEVSNIHRIGVLPDKGDVFYRVSIKVLKLNDKAKQDSFTWQNTRDNKEFLKKISDFNYKKFYNINGYYSSDEKKRDSSDFFDQIVVKESVVLVSNSLYTPSDGEESILSITGLLENTEYDCYLFDEIERGLGNKYIANQLIPKLKRLRDFDKYVVLSTHNANIAISTLPSNTIYCNFEENGNNEIYYQGNMFSNELIAIDTGKVINWEKKAIDHLEGGESMFGIRRNVWD